MEQSSKIHPAGTVPDAADGSFRDPAEPCTVRHVPDRSGKNTRRYLPENDGQSRYSAAETEVFKMNTTMILTVGIILSPTVKQSSVSDHFEHLR